MKKILFFLLTCLISIPLYSQTSGGPDAYGYTWKNSNHTVNPPVFGWLDISGYGNEVTGLADDNVIGPYGGSAGFQFYWYPTPQFWIGSNGYLSFAGNNIAAPFPATIPSSAGSNNFIGMMMSDLNFSGANNPAECYMYYNADTLVVSYVNVPFWYNNTQGYTGSNTFQVILSKVDNSITINYLSTNLGTVSATTFDCAVGIENNTGTLGLSSIIDVLPADSLTVKFYYPDTVTYAVTDASVLWNDNMDNGGIFVKKNAPAMSLKANYKNTGNQNLSSFTARDTIYNFYNFIQSSGNASVPPLVVGADTTVTFSNTWSPTVTGIYSFNSGLTGVSGDMVASNNVIQQEIVVVDTSQTTFTLEYTDGTADGGGLGWNGGNGGVGVYIEPPIYPVEIVSTRYFITANAVSPVGFYAKIYDDNGPNGTAGTMLDSVYVPPTSITTNTYTTVNAGNSNLIIYSGGVYVCWYMAAAEINIGRDVTPPISRRTYEVLGGSWSDYRDRYTEDFLIGLNVSIAAVPQASFSVNMNNSPSIAFTDQSTNSPTSWFWNFDDGGGTDTSHQQNPTYVFQSAGNHNVCLTATNSVGMSLPYCQNVNIVSVGLEKDAQYLVTYPNPFTDKLYIALSSQDDTQEVRMICRNLVGQVMDFNYSMEGDHIVVSRDDQPSGVYLFEVWTGKKKFGTGKFILK